MTNQTKSRREELEELECGGEGHGVRKLVKIQIQKDNCT